MPFVPISPRRAVDEAVSQLATAVRMGDLGLGERLPSERELAAQMQISRPTVRDALRVLSDEGIVEVGAAGAVVVADRVPRQLLHAHRELRERDVPGVLEARRLVEPRVAQLAAVNAEEEDFEAMSAAIERHRQLAAGGLKPEDEDLFLQVDLQFHLLIARATRNDTIVRIMHGLIQDVELVWSMLSSEFISTDYNIDINDRTLAAIRSRRLEHVDAVMDEHLRGIERLWEAASGRALVRPTPEFLRPMATSAHRANSAFGPET